MAFLENSVRFNPEPVGSDTLPDSYSLSDSDESDQPHQSGGKALLSTIKKPIEPSDWRIEYRRPGRPRRHWICPFLYLPILIAYAFLGAWLFTIAESPTEGNHGRESCDAFHGPFNHIIFDGLPYSISVFTTVGYGIQAPKTTTGRLITILYAFIGIPLYFAFSADLQDLLDQIVFVWLFGLYFRCRNGKPQKIARWVKCLTMLILALSWLLIQACITMVIENIEVSCSEPWSYMTALYFDFQSAALIGFGDLMTTRNLYLVVHLPTFILGQVLFTGLFTAMIKYIRYRFPKWTKRCWIQLRYKLLNLPYQKKRQKRRSTKTAVSKKKPSNLQITVEKATIIPQDVVKNDDAEQNAL